MSECPAENDLTGFLNESLPTEQMTLIAAHVDGCSDCQARLDRLTHQSAPAVAQYKDISSIILPKVADSAPLLDDATLIIAGNAPPLPSPARHRYPKVPGFDILAEIGRGGMGIVYKARHRRLNRLCALKMILAGGAANPSIVQRFLFEAEVLAKVRHPRVVQVYEADTYLGPGGVPIPYLAMELLEGGNLAEKLKSGTLSAREAAALIQEIAEAVHAMHLQGVVHRDLKPGNIMFGSGFDSRSSTEAVAASGNQSPASSLASSSRPVAKVSDFGLAKFTQGAGADLSTTGQIVGTPAYMAPEQATGDKLLGPGADVYALGAILYTCLTGRPPFVGEPLSVLMKVVNEPPTDVRTLRQELPKDLGAVVMKCLEKEPRLRYGSAGELAEDLHRFLDNRPTQARPLWRRERLWLWARRNPAVAGLLSLLMVVLVVGFTAVMGLWMRAERTAENERLARQSAVQAGIEADDARAAALLAKTDAEHQRQIAELQQARLELTQASDLCENSQPELGLPPLIRALELAERNNDRSLAHVARVNLAAWMAAFHGPRRGMHHNPLSRQVAFTPDGRHMISAGNESTVFLWDANTGEKLRTYKTNPTFVRLRYLLFAFYDVAVSPDGRTIVAGGSDGQLWVWDYDRDVARAAIRVTTPGGDENVWAVAFTPEGKVWATDGLHGVKLWDLGKPDQPIAELRLDQAKAEPVVVQSLALNREGTRLFTGDREGQLREWDVATGRQLATRSLGNWVQDIAIAPDGNEVLTVARSGVCRIYKLPLERTTPTNPQPGLLFELPMILPAHGCAYVPGGNAFLVGDTDGFVRVIDRRTGVAIGDALRYPGNVNRPRFRPRTAELGVAAGNSVSLCRILDPAGLPIGSRDELANHVRFSPTGDRLAVVTTFGVTLYDPILGKLLREYRLPTPSVWIEFDPRLPRLIRGSHSSVETIDLADGRITVGSPVQAGITYVAQLEPGATRLITVNNSALVGRWDLNRLKLETTMRPWIEPPGRILVQGLSLHPDGREFLVTYRNRVEFLSLATLAPCREGWDAPDEINDACFTHDGHVLLGMRNNSAQVFDAKTGRPLTNSLRHTRQVATVCESPDGTMFLTASLDGIARFWDSTTGLQLGPPLRHAGPVVSAAFSPRGARVATVSTGLAFIWSTPPAPLPGTPQQLRAMIQPWINNAGDPLVIAGGH